ncbi:MAG: hypothetical protein WCF90_08075 [Methanomicrobiales archaeon]
MGISWGQWVNSVAVSRYASDIVAAGIDQNLYIVDHGGKLLVKKQTFSIIYPWALAISAKGTHIAVADEYALIRFSLSLEEMTEQVTPIPRTTTRYTDTVTPVPTIETTRAITSVIPKPVTTLPLPIKSPLNPAGTMLAAGLGSLEMLGMRRS